MQSPSYTGIRLKKLNKVRALSGGRHILCLQEVHGVYHEVVASFARVLPGWKVFFSGFVSDDGSASTSTGGVLFLVSPSHVQLRGLDVF